MTTAAPAALTPGTTVWSVKLNWGLVSGSMIRDRYGVSGGELGSPAILTVRKAGSEYRCDGCRSLIPRGALHGSNSGAHYCPGCVTTVEPASEFKTGRC